METNSVAAHFRKELDNEFPRADVPGREKILKGRIDKIRHRYDHILFDNPPSLNLLTLTR